MLCLEVLQIGFQYVLHQLHFWHMYTVQRSTNMSVLAVVTCCRNRGCISRRGTCLIRGIVISRGGLPF